MKRNHQPLLVVLTVVSMSVMPASAQWVRWPASAGGNGHWYRPVAMPAPISWAAALAGAQAGGGYLVSITSAQENAFVFGLIDFPQYWSGEDGPALGGYQPPGSPEPAGGWTWVSGEPWTYSNWAAGQPDNNDVGPEDGLHFWVRTGGGRGPTWNDKMTNRALFVSYVIERDAPPLPAQWVRWPVSAGGNGHWYRPVAVPAPISWAAALASAPDEGGYLASITSAAENAFVFGLIDFPQYWDGETGPVLGGYQPPGSPEPAGGWTWISGEPWTYSNWAAGQPDNNDVEPEDGLHFWVRTGGGRGPTWNDKMTNRAMFVSYVLERDAPPWPVVNIRPSEVEISWETDANTIYQVQYQSDLTTNAWVALTTNAIAGTGGTYSIYDTVPRNAPRRFYRVVMIP